MGRQNALGAVLLTVCLVAGLSLWDSSLALVNAGALALVVGGTALAAVLTFPMQRLRQAVREALHCAFCRAEDVKDIICTLFDFSLRSRFSGTLDFSREEEEVDQVHLQSALALLSDGYSRDEIREILENEARFFQMRGMGLVQVFRHLARVAPSFGVAGSVAGLVAMLAGIGDQAAMLAAIPLALVSTLYGILLQQLVFIPAAELIENNMKDRLLGMGVILEGIIAIRCEQNPRKVERRLLAFVPPNQRTDTADRLGEIRRTYVEMAARRRAQEQQAA
jgi:chemotaxis protein MotA